MGDFVAGMQKREDYWRDLESKAAVQLQSYIKNNPYATQADVKNFAKSLGVMNVRDVITDSSIQRALQVNRDNLAWRDEQRDAQREQWGRQEEAGGYAKNRDAEATATFEHKRDNWDLVDDTARMQNEAAQNVLDDRDWRVENIRPQDLKLKGLQVEAAEASKDQAIWNKGQRADKEKLTKLQIEAAELAQQNNMLNSVARGEELFEDALQEALGAPLHTAKRSTGDISAIAFQVAARLKTKHPELGEVFDRSAMAIQRTSQSRLDKRNSIREQYHAKAANEFERWLADPKNASQIEGPNSANVIAQAEARFKSANGIKDDASTGEPVRLLSEDQINQAINAATQAKLIKDRRMFATIHNDLNNALGNAALKWTNGQVSGGERSGPRGPTGPYQEAAMILQGYGYNDEIVKEFLQTWNPGQHRADEWRSAMNSNAQFIRSLVKTHTSLDTVIDRLGWSGYDVPQEHLDSISAALSEPSNVAERKQARSDIIKDEILLAMPNIERVYLDYLDGDMTQVEALTKALNEGELKHYGDVTPDEVLQLIHQTEFDRQSKNVDADMRAAVSSIPAGSTVKRERLEAEIVAQGIVSGDFKLKPDEKQLMLSVVNRGYIQNYNQLDIAIQWLKNTEEGQEFANSLGDTSVLGKAETFFGTLKQYAPFASAYASVDQQKLAVLKNYQIKAEMLRNPGLYAEKWASHVDNQMFSNLEMEIANVKSLVSGPHTTAELETAYARLEQEKARITKKIYGEIDKLDDVGSGLPKDEYQNIRETIARAQKNKNGYVTQITNLLQKREENVSERAEVSKQELGYDTSLLQVGKPDYNQHLGHNALKANFSALEKMGHDAKAQIDPATINQMFYRVSEYLKGEQKFINNLQNRMGDKLGLNAPAAPLLDVISKEEYDRLMAYINLDMAKLYTDMVHRYSAYKDYAPGKGAPSKPNLLEDIKSGVDAIKGVFD